MQLQKGWLVKTFIHNLICTSGTNIYKSEDNLALGTSDFATLVLYQMMHTKICLVGRIVYKREMIARLHAKHVSCWKLHTKRHAVGKNIGKHSSVRKKWKVQHFLCLWKWFCYFVHIFFNEIKMMPKIELVLWNGQKCICSLLTKIHYFHNNLQIVSFTLVILPAKRFYIQPNVLKLLLQTLFFFNAGFTVWLMYVNFFWC